MIYRKEHPKPQFMRENWVNLNGEWQFEIDGGNSGKERGLFENDVCFSQRITVPFCPESKLSGVENKDFMSSVWYKREFNIGDEQLKGRVIIHFGAVDYYATVYINGRECGTHKGGYVSFSFDITDYVKAGKNIITVNAADDTRDGHIPSGKQSGLYHSYGCFYTRTTGIWQTVWLEFVPKTHIVNAKYTTRANDGLLIINARLEGKGTLSAQAFYENRKVGEETVFSAGGETVLTISLSEKHLWEVGHGRLYDLVLTFEDDVVKSYFGLRSLRLEGNKFLINEKPIFQRLVLDQGFYPDGIYTAPSDSELSADIERSLAMGFNGARLHEKVFEERFLYHCDRLGYIVWGEYPNWGLDISSPDSIYGILPEWLDEIERDYNHPSIVGWCPLNETWSSQFREMVSIIYKATKTADPARPCIDASGFFHVQTDIYDLHDYAQDAEEFARHYESLGKANEFDFESAHSEYQKYDGKMPFFVSEYGGAGLSVDENGWGYGNNPTSQEEFMERIRLLTNVLLKNKNIFGFCYTQLTDVEQEQNGLYTYDRKPKFPPEKISQIFSAESAFERDN